MIYSDNAIALIVLLIFSLIGLTTVEIFISKIFGNIIYIIIKNKKLREHR